MVDFQFWSEDFLQNFQENYENDLNNVIDGVTPDDLIEESEDISDVT